MSLTDITAATVSLQSGATYYAKIQLTGAEATFGTASDVAEKFGSLGFTSITIWDTSNVPAIFPDRAAFSSGDTYWARGSYSGSARAVGLPSEIKRVWINASNQPAPAPGGYTPPPDFVGPPEPGWNWPIAPTPTPGPTPSPTPTPTPKAPMVATTSAAASTPRNLIIGIVAFAALSLAVYEFSRRGQR